MGISGRDDCVAKNSHTLPRQSNRAARKSFTHKLLCSRTEYIYIYGTFWNCLKILYIYILFRLNVVACRRLKGFNKLLYQYTQHVSTLIISTNHPICLAHKYINLSHDRTFYSIKRFAFARQMHDARWKAPIALTRVVYWVVNFCGVALHQTKDMLMKTIRGGLMNTRVFRHYICDKGLLPIEYMYIKYSSHENRGLRGRMFWLFELFFFYRSLWGAWFFKHLYIL